MDPFSFIVPAFLVAFALLWATVYFVGYPKDHGGVGWLQMRRVLENGAAATATIAAQREVRTFGGGGRRSPVHVTEYLLDVTHGSERLRASVTLPLRAYEQSEIAKTKPLPVRVGEGIVAIDRRAVRAAVTEREKANKASENDAFEKLRKTPPK